MNPPIPVALTVLLLVAASVVPAPAQTPRPPDASSPTGSLDRVLITASREPETIFETPYTAHVLGNERFIGERLVRSLPDALTETPGVLVQKTGYGQASPFIRGFTGFRTLLLIDGIRLNNATFREGPNQYFSTIDALTVDRLEVVKGPSSVLYGSDAIGGTLNTLTRFPEMLPFPAGPPEPTPAAKDAKGAADSKSLLGPSGLPRVAFHPAAFYRYATAENSHTVRGEISLAVTPRFGVLGGFTYRDFDDLEGGDVIGLQRNSAYGEINADVKAFFRPTENIDLTAAYFRVEQNNVPRTHSTIFGKSFDGTAVGTDLRRDFDQRRELAYVQAEVREIAPWLGSARVSLSFHRQSEEQDRIRNNGLRELSGFRDDQFGALLSFVSPAGRFGTFTYGAEYYRDEVQSDGRDFNADGSLRLVRSRGPIADDSSYDLFGVYAQHVFQPVRPLEITLGGRYSLARAEAKGDKIDPNLADSLTFADLDETFNAFTGSVRARLDLARDWNLFGGVSQGFRAPNLSDFTSFELARSGERETPSTNLDSERFTAFEIGTKARLPKLRANVYAAYHYTFIEDQIVRFPTGALVNGNEPEVSRANAGDGFVQGVEAGADWNFYGGFSVFGNLSYTEGEVDTLLSPGVVSREPATRIQPLTGLVGLRWESDDRKLFVEGSLQLAGRQDRLAPTDVTDTQRIPPGGTRGYQVFSLRASYAPWRQTRFFAAVENVGDEDYRYHGSGINEPGTNFVFGTQVRY